MKRGSRIGILSALGVLTLDTFYRSRRDGPVFFALLLFVITIFPWSMLDDSTFNELPFGLVYLLASAPRWWRGVDAKQILLTMPIERRSLANAVWLFGAFAGPLLLFLSACALRTYSNLSLNPFVVLIIGISTTGAISQAATSPIRYEMPNWKALPLHRSLGLLLLFAIWVLCLAHIVQTAPKRWIDFTPMTGIVVAIGFVFLLNSYRRRYELIHPVNLRAITSAAEEAYLMKKAEKHPESTGLPRAAIDAQSRLRALISLYKPYSYASIAGAVMAIGALSLLEHGLFPMLGVQIEVPFGLCLILLPIATLFSRGVVLHQPRALRILPMRGITLTLVLIGFSLSVHLVAFPILLAACTLIWGLPPSFVASIVLLSFGASIFSMFAYWGVPELGATAMRTAAIVILAIIGLSYTYVEFETTISHPPHRPNLDSLLGASGSLFWPALIGLCGFAMALIGAIGVYLSVVKGRWHYTQKTSIEEMMESQARKWI